MSKSSVGRTLCKMIKTKKEDEIKFILFFVVLSNI